MRALRALRGPELTLTQTQGHAAVSALRTLTVPDLRTLTALAHGHYGECWRMPKLTFPPRVACAPLVLLCLSELTVAGHVLASEPGELGNWGRWGDWGDSCGGGGGGDAVPGARERALCAGVDGAGAELGAAGVGRAQAWIHAPRAHEPPTPSQPTATPSTASSHTRRYTMTSSKGTRSLRSSSSRTSPRWSCEPCMTHSTRACGYSRVHP